MTDDEFPRGLHNQALGTVAEDTGAATPSHGGTVTAALTSAQGTSTHIAKAEEKQVPTPPDTPAVQLAPRPRPVNPAAIAARRLVSMPPQSSAQAAAIAERLSVDENREREKETRRSKTQEKSRGRVLGDYVLTKTLGAGSMGKVKLAVHTPTGPKVRMLFCANTVQLAIKIVPRVSTHANGQAEDLLDSRTQTLLPLDSRIRTHLSRRGYAY